MLDVNLIKIYERSFRENRELPALTDYFKKETFSYYEMAKEIAKIHLLLKKAGIKQGDKIALLGRANPRWCITYLAVMTYGAVIVPILQDFNNNDIIHIINHSESRLLFVGDNYWDVMEPAQVERLEAVFSLTDFHCIFEREGHSLSKYQKDITKHYREVYPNGFSATDIVYPDIPNNHVCLLNYTSGTTGYSKGVMLTINNLTANVQFAIDEHLYFRGSRILSFLPLAHAYGCAFDFLSPLAVGTHVTLLGKIPAAKILLEAMREVRPHVVCCVPLILEKIYRKQIAPLLEKGPMRYALKIPLIDHAIYSTFRRKLLDVFGGEVGQFIVGGAAISPDTEEFLMRIKFPITVGYGMTETAPLISYTYWTDFKPGSVGRFLQNYLEVKIDSPDPAHVEGEIVVRGENVMAGYYKNDDATAEVLRDGWLHTGDIGTMDDDGTLYIRGRSKTMILTAAGQNIYPEEIEAKLNNLYLVMESLVVERGGRLVAMVYPDYETAQTEGVADESIPEIMERNLAELNTLVAPFERVASIVIYPTEFEKTPKKSIRRYLYQL
ncbi:MAG: AMP-binding protein [Alistipes sp.]|jgi:long-chain acyl-CoA synthetase|nr:AMP-binding protein [Alistipes sp.]